MYAVVALLRSWRPSRQPVIDFVLERVYLEIKQPLSALADRGEFVRGTTLSCTSLFRLANRQRNVLETSAPTLFRAAAYGWASLPACWRLAPDAASLAAVAGKFSRSSHFVLKLKATHHCVLYIIATCARFVKRKFSLSPKSNIRVLVEWKLYNGDNALAML